MLKREPVFEGFAKTGEKLICSSCGFEYATEAEVPFKKEQAEPVIFTDADRTSKIEVFEEFENQQLCRYCANYIVNPFTQFCSIHKKEVQATDTCKSFKPAEEQDETHFPI